MKKIVLNSIWIIGIFFIIYSFINTFEVEKEFDIQENVYQENITPVVSKEEKITVNTKGKMNISYMECGHVEEIALDLDDTFINLNEDKFKEKFIGWNIKEFSESNVEIEKEVDGYCYNHFVIKLAENKIMIYRKLNEADEELFKETDIGVEFLTEEDILKLEEGIEVYAVENLNSVLEDFE